MALQMLYQQDLGGRESEEILASFDPAGLADFVAAEAAEATEAEQEGENGEPEAEPEPEPALSQKELDKAFDYASRLVRGALERREELDAKIRERAENWRLERMPVIDRNILRLAIFEMLFMEGVPKVVILDEAIELAKRFGSEKSSRFVNGLLDGILKRSGEKAESGTPS